MSFYRIVFFTFISFIICGFILTAEASNSTYLKWVEANITIRNNSVHLSSTRNSRNYSYNGKLRFVEQSSPASNDSVSFPTNMPSSQSYFAGQIGSYNRSVFLIVDNTLVHYSIAGTATIQNIPGISKISKGAKIISLHVEMASSPQYFLWVDDPNPNIRGTYSFAPDSSGKEVFTRYSLKHPLFDLIDEKGEKTIDRTTLEKILANNTYKNSYKKFLKSMIPIGINPNPAAATTLIKDKLVVSEKSRVIDSKTKPDSAKLLANPAIKKIKVDTEDKHVPLDKFIESNFDVIRSVAPASAEEYANEEKNILLGITGMLMDGGSIKILGKPGTGKSYFTDLLVSYIFNTPLNKAVSDRVYIRLTSGALTADSGVLGPFFSKVKALKDLSHIVPITLVIEEMHTLIGAGTHKNSSVDFFQLIKTELANGQIKIIGNTTDSEFYRNFGGDQALLDRFAITINISESNKEATIEKMKSYLKKVLLTKPNLKINLIDEMFEQIYEVSDRFDPIGAQPRKSHNLLKFIIASVEANNDSEITVKKINDYASTHYGYDIFRYQPETLFKLMSDFSKKLNSTHEGLFDSKEALGLFFSGHTFSQIAAPTPEPASILLYGPKGSGKTSIARSVSAGLNRPIKEIVTTRFADHDVDKFRTEIGMAIKTNPFTVILLDEIDKAPLRIQQAALDILGSGRFTARLSNVATQESASEIYASHAIFIGTTNAGQELAGKKHSRADFERATYGILDEYFLDRFKTVIPMAAPSRLEVENILSSKWTILDTHLKKLGYNIHVDRDSLVNYLLDKISISSQVSVRQLSRELDLIWQHISRQITLSPDVKDISLSFSLASFDKETTIKINSFKSDKSASFSCKKIYTKIRPN